MNDRNGLAEVIEAFWDGWERQGDGTKFGCIVIALIIVVTLCAGFIITIVNVVT